MSLTATKDPQFTSSLEPVTFVIIEANTGPEYTEPLQRDLEAELRRRAIRGQAIVLTGAEYNAEQIIGQAAQSSTGLVFIQPAGGTSYGGTLKQILYHVEAVQVLPGETEGETQGRVVWRAKVDTNSGAYKVQIENRLELFAERLVGRLVRDRLLPHRVVQ